MSGSNYLGHFTRTRDAHRKNGREIGRWGDETVVLSVIRVVYVMEDPVMRSGHLSDGVYSGRAWWNEMYDARVCGEKAGLSRSDHPVEGDMDGPQDGTHKPVAGDLQAEGGLRKVVMNAGHEAGDAFQARCILGCPGELVK